MVAAGVMGLPPTNGVLPQAPMHTHALSVSLRLLFPFSFLGSRPATQFQRAKNSLFSLFRSLFKNQVAAGERARKIAAAAEVEEEQAEAEAEAAVTAAAGYGGSRLQRRRPASKKDPSTVASATPPPPPPPEHYHHHHQPLEPLETRVASFLQYMCILACAFAGPMLRLIPRGAIAGYFAFMALEWVADSEMVDRVRWLLSDAQGRASVRRPAAAFAADAAAAAAAAVPMACEGVLSSTLASSAAEPEAGAAPPLPPPPPPPPPPPARWTRAPTKSIAAFTAFQVACVALVYALTWVPVAGILFPVPIMLFVPLRTFVLPRVFGRAQIELLDGP